MKESMKVFMVCFLGAFIGTVVALQFGMFWWFGLIIGGLVGYLAYEFKMVLQAIPKAWQAVTEWRPDKKWWKNYFSLLWPAFCIGFTVAIGYVMFFSALFLLHGENDRTSTMVLFATVGAIFAAVILCTPIGCLLATKEKESKEWLYSIAKRYNPVTFYLWLIPKSILELLSIILKWFFLVIYHAPEFFWKIAIIVGHFIKTLFVLVHSDERLLCGIDSAIGAAIGYIAGNALIGGLAGGLFGVINYEIVSKRIFHLIPKRN